MMIYILDCSFCAALFLPDEESEKINKIFDSISDNDEVFIPHLWWYELSNVLSVAVKRNRLTYSHAVHINSLLSSFNFITESTFGNIYSEKLLEITQCYHLSAYDAAYLELAVRKQGALGTLDKDLRKACIEAGIVVL
jgi:predicted nucleic acid-binding protein